MNTVIICGYVGKISVTEKIIKFGICTSEPYKVGDKFEKKTSWHNITVFGKLMNYAKFINTGDTVLVEGKLNYFQTEKDSVKFNITSIIANSLSIVKSKNPKEEVQPVTDPLDGELPF